MKKTITNSSHNKLSNNKKRSLKRLFLFAENAQIFGLFPSGSVIMEWRGLDDFGMSKSNSSASMPYKTNYRIRMR